MAHLGGLGRKLPEERLHSRRGRAPGAADRKELAARGLAFLDLCLSAGAFRRRMGVRDIEVEITPPGAPPSSLQSGR